MHNVFNPLNWEFKFLSFKVPVFNICKQTIGYIKKTETSHVTYRGFLHNKSLG